MDDKDIKIILENAKTIAMIGIVRKKKRKIRKKSKGNQQML